MNDDNWQQRGGILAILPSFLFARTAGVPRYILSAWLMSAVGSALLGMLLWLTPAPTTESPLMHADPLTVLFGVVIVSPVLETILMAGVLLLLRRFLAPGWAAIVSALGWAVAHSLSSPLWGLVVWWPFLIFSIAFLTWRPTGLWRAVGIVILIHMLQNLLPALLIVRS